MQPTKFFALVGIVLFLITKIPTTYAQTSDATQYHVVVGAFAIEENAQRFQQRVHNEFSLDAVSSFKPHRNLYYVSILATAVKEDAKKEALRLREETYLKDAWVYIDGPDNTLEVFSPDTHPGTDKPIDVIPVQDQVAIDKKPTLPAVGKPFLFPAYRSNGDTVRAQVSVIDVKTSRKVATYTSNTIVGVTSKTESASLICDAFGYRKVQREISLASPQGDGITEENGVVTVPFEMVRLQKGDIAVMYNVFFFKDAAIMRPESRYEVESLTEMLKENQNYKIKIHGHTNGKAHGKIISPEKDTDQYFSLANSKEGFGSAKELSEQRATLIKDYLVSNGIGAERMEIKAWGGKRPIHDKHSTKAAENVRVEIEILAH